MGKDKGEPGHAKLEPVSAGSEAVVRLCREVELDAVVGLGNVFKRHLGLYPRGAILEAITQGRVIGAFQGEDLAGYALFDLPRSDIRLVHLCVREGSRGSGVARRLVDEIQHLNPDRDGIRLKCRRDYEAHQLWPRLGFEARSHLRGRGKSRADMVAWWRGFGKADLFSSALEDDERVLAVLDTNVVLDIALGRDPLTLEFLEAPGLVGEVTLCMARSVRNELSETADSCDRERVMKSLGQFQAIHAELAACEKLTSEFISAIGFECLEKDSSLFSDTRVLAEAVVGGASVLITNDDNAAHVLRPIGLTHGVDVLHPSQLIVKIDQLKGLRRDSPDRIQNTSVVVQQGGPGLDRELDHLISTYSGESKSGFRALVRAKTGLQVATVHAEESGLVDGLVVSDARSGSLVIELFRIRRSPLASTLVRQLIFQLRHQSLRAGTHRIVFQDPHPGGGIRIDAELAAEGARLVDGRWTFEVVDAQLHMRAILSGSGGHWELGPWLPSEPAEPLGPDEFARLERELWPLKILDAPLNSYVIPIRPYYASELLGYDTPLLSRSDSLGISRRHVYFKSPGIRPRSPGRILWYVSGKRGGLIVAASQLVSTHQASPATLHSRFQKYGVWNLADIEARARRGNPIAVRFGDTEIFTRNVKLSEAEEIVAKYGNQLAGMPTARAIANDAFHEIYGRGMNR